MMTDYNADKLMDAVEALAAARFQVLDNQQSLMITEAELSHTKALAEIEIVEAAGGKLGPNPEARKRKMTLGLTVHEDYQNALARRTNLYLMLEWAKIKVRNAEDLVRALRVIMETG